MSKLNLSVLLEVSASADDVIKAIAGKSDDVHPDNSTAICRLYDDLNDRHAPPAIVKAMADELINLRQLNRIRQAQRIIDRRRFVDSAVTSQITLEHKIAPSQPPLTKENSHGPA